MVVRLRLQRLGRRNLPFYRIVAADVREARNGKFLEMLGTYNPIPNKDNIKEISLRPDRIQYWMSVGAQPSDRVAYICGKLGVLPMPPHRNSVQSAIPKDLREKGKKDAAKK